MSFEFIELPAFTRAMDSHGLSDDWLSELQQDFVRRRGVVYRPKGLGGLHKRRVANPERSKGKRGGFRVYYLDCSEHGVIIFAALSDKDYEANISAYEQSKLKALAARLRKEVERYARQKQRP